MRSRVALAVGALLLVGLIAAVIAHSRVWQDDAAFDRAKRMEAEAGDEYEKAMGAYRGYLAEYPRGRHASEARAKVERELPGLIDDREWKHVRALDTRAAYEGYLQRLPDGKWQEQARRQLQLKKQQAQREAEALRRAEQQAERQFRKGRMVYLYDPSPAVVTRSPTVCKVKYIRRANATVRGELTAHYVTKDGKSQTFPKGTAGKFPELTARRGTLSVSLSEQWCLKDADHVELVFIDWSVGPGMLYVSELSNAVVVRCR